MVRLPNISALYVLAAIILVFSLTIPHTFLAATTWRTLLDNQVVLFASSGTRCR